MARRTEETTDIDRETGTTVSSDYTAVMSRCNDDHDHFVTDEERLRIALARQ